MISLGTVFWIMVSFFTFVGFLRGWTKEVIAMAGLVLSLFALNQFGPLLIGLLGSVGEITPGELMPVERRQFYLLAAVHIFITFFSYQGPTLAGSRFRDRLGVRDNFRDKILGGLFGALNGYLIVGTLWSFLEYRVVAPAQWERLAAGISYPFAEAVIRRPPIDSPMATLIENLPLPVLAPYLPFLIVLVFLFVIIVMI